MGVGGLYRQLVAYLTQLGIIGVLEFDFLTRINLYVEFDINYQHFSQIMLNSADFGNFETLRRRVGGGLYCQLSGLFYKMA